MVALRCSVKLIRARKKTLSLRDWRNSTGWLGMADILVVNSSWSASLLAKAGVSDEKIRIVPLAYRPKPASGGHPRRKYPEAFSINRPLHLLFLGQVNLRKGALELIAAVRRLYGAPLRLLFVGPVEPGLFNDIRLPPNVEWVGPVAGARLNSTINRPIYSSCQRIRMGLPSPRLEALARGVPVITSRHCGDAITDGENGLLIEDVSVDSIEEKLRWALDLAEMAARAPAVLSGYTPEYVVDRLLAEVSTIPR